jgi:hypothetical protein
MPAYIIDKGIPTAALMSQVIVAKHLDHIPVYRQEQTFGRAGVPIPRSTLAEWIGRCGVQLQPLVDALRALILTESVLHADETPVPMLAPGKKKTHKAYIWAYATTPYSELNAVIYAFTPGRSGQHARDFLDDWQGQLVCDDYGGYKASFKKGITEIGCMAHYLEFIFIPSRYTDRTVRVGCSALNAKIIFWSSRHATAIRCRLGLRALPGRGLTGGAQKHEELLH